MKNIFPTGHTAADLFHNSGQAAPNTSGYNGSLTSATGSWYVSATLHAAVEYTVKHDYTALWGCWPLKRNRSMTYSRQEQSGGYSPLGEP
jgi:hypothetical protein